ncbi:MAG: NUDIX hydrolase [Candidatus Micrarchaeia archaeon]
MRPTTVDSVIVEDGKILLIKRKFKPFKGKWALPGGFVDEGETVEEAVERETMEETGMKVRIVKLIGVYSNPKRDPRGTISIAFLTKPTSKEARGGDDAEEARWFNLNELPEMAFDHKKIIEDARRML